jgi:alkyl hydroperoxide reductase subunit AhpF
MSATSGWRRNVPFLSAADAAKVQTFFGDHLQDPVTIELFTEQKSMLYVPGRRECEYCAETEELLTEVAGLSDKVTLVVNDVRSAPDAAAAEGIASDMVPAFVLKGAGRGKLRFFGIPAGYEFSSLIQDVVDVSTGSTHLTQATKDELANLENDVHIRVFVTPT